MIQKGSTSGTAVGAKLGRTKGNKQEAEYENREQGMGNQAGSKGKDLGSVSGTGAPGKPAVRQKREESGKEERKAE